MYILYIYTHICVYVYIYNLYIIYIIYIIYIVDIYLYVHCYPLFNETIDSFWVG